MAVKRLVSSEGQQELGELGKIKARFKSKFQDLEGDIAGVGNLAQAKVVLEKMRKFIGVLGRYAFREQDGE